jgi:LPXTG-site transpeptidase (sortase) family protein
VSNRPSTSPARRHFVAVAGLVFAAAAVTAGCGGGAQQSVAMPIAQTSSPSEPEGSPPTTRWPDATQEKTSPNATQKKTVTQQPTVSKPVTPPRRRQFASPVTVSMPSVELFARLKPLYVDSHNKLVPPQYGLAGWYKAGPEPGEIGAAVIAGHLDNKNGADVFANLNQAKPGDRIRVGLKDGKTLTFRVTAIKQFPQNNFPTQRVYGATKNPELRLLTCGGKYDHAAGHYLDNLVVFADLAT